MDLSPDPDLETFRNEVRGFLRRELPPEIAYRPRVFMSRREDIVRWQTILNEQGWGAPSWPKEYGGAGWSPQQCLVFEEECVAAGTPTQDIVGQKLLGPLLQEFGTPDQIAKHFPPILRGESIWAHGFSEAQAGSDLASIRTIAAQDGDDYLVSGTKKWISYAHQADWIFMIARTLPYPDRRGGFHVLLVDMRSVGITIAPIRTVARFHHLNEVIFDAVRVPKANLVGEAGKGWTVARHLLDGSHAAVADLPSLRAYLWQMKELSGNQTAGGKLLVEGREFAIKLGRFEAEVDAITMMVARVAALSQIPERAAELRALSSMLKLRSTDLQQRMIDFLLEAIGDFGAVETDTIENDPTAASLPGFAGNIAPELFFRRSSTIYGGSSEIQRAIIARSHFGM